MKPPSQKIKSNRIDMPRMKIPNLPIYRALDEGSRFFREEEFSLVLLPRQNKPKTYLYVSELYKCARFLWLELNAPNHFQEKPEDPFNDPENLRSSHLGDILEAYVIHLLNLGNLNVTDQQKRISYLDNKLSGRIDGIITLKEKNVLIEIKALRHDKIVELNAFGVKKEMPHYYNQIQMYLYALDKMDFGYLIAFDIDTKQFYVEQVKNNWIRVDELNHKAKYILEAEVIQKLPEYLLERECFFCPARKICETVDKDKFEILYKNYQERKK